MMEIKQVDAKEFREIFDNNRKWRKNTKMRDIVDSFIASGYDVSEIKFSDGEYKRIDTPYAGIINVIKRKNLTDEIGVCMRKEKLYIYRKNSVDKH